ncbi:MAG: helicase-associated domain-containing protein [Sporichthyaceae bacterium]
MARPPRRPAFFDDVGADEDLLSALTWAGGQGGLDDDGTYAAAPTVDSCARFLARLDDTALTAVLAARPDSCRPPTPCGFARLAQRLCGAASLAEAMESCDRDEVRLLQALAARDGTSTVADLVLVTGSDESLVAATLDRLTRRALVWPEGPSITAPSALVAHWTGHLTGRSAHRIARGVRADELRVAVDALGIRSTGLRKPELEAAYGAAFAELAALRDHVAELGPEAITTAAMLGAGATSMYVDYHLRATFEAGCAQLTHAGLAVRLDRFRVEVPREVAVAGWLAGIDLALTGAPEIAVATDVPGTGADEAQSLLAIVTALLDEAGARAVAALKSGGVGAKERSRLAGLLATDAGTVALCVDLASATGLLARTDHGYGPSDHYRGWRDAEPAAQWASLALAWLQFEHASTRRRLGEGKEVAPPLPLDAGVRGLRRSLLQAGRGPDGGLRDLVGVVAALPWLHPLQHGDPGEQVAQVAATLVESGLLGLTHAGALSTLGTSLLDALAAADPLTELIARSGVHLAAEACTLILQSDLTALVTGRADSELAELLITAATNEARGNAELWRFSPAGVRNALDHGWEADRILAVLQTRTDREVPQPLSYLVHDVARRHGNLQIHPGACVLTGDEALVAEVAVTRALRALHLRVIAPTVLVSLSHPDTVLETLRRAGLFPVRTDADGIVQLDARPDGATPAWGEVPGSSCLSPRSAGVTATPAELFADLRADPEGRSALSRRTPQRSAIAQQVRHLTADEIDLLTHAIEAAAPVRIGYHDRTGSHTVRVIIPAAHYGRWITAWCQLRNAEREFTLANISSASPA